MGSRGRSRNRPRPQQAAPDRLALLQQELHAASPNGLDRIRKIEAEHARLLDTGLPEKCYEAHHNGRIIYDSEEVARESRRKQTELTGWRMEIDQCSTTEDIHWHLRKRNTPSWAR
jgi:hypothetical protein